MNTTAQRVHLRPRYRGLLWFRCTAVIVLVVAGGLAPKSYAEERLTQAGDASSHAPADFQSEALDEKALSAIHGKGGANILQSPVNLSIILWDEPGGGGAKRQALAENTPDDSIRGSLFNRYDGVSIGRK